MRTFSNLFAFYEGKFTAGHKALIAYASPRPERNATVNKEHLTLPNNGLGTGGRGANRLGEIGYTE